MDQLKRAETAINLLRHAMRTDDQNGFELLSGLIEAEGLYRYCINDAGEPIDNMQDFGQEMNHELSEFERGAGTVSASAGRSAARARHTAGRMSLQAAMSKLDIAMASIRQECRASA